MKHATVLTARLHESERAALESHFLALDGGDRRLRFGLPIADEGLRAYAARIDFAEHGRRDWTRTNDPHHVKVVL